MGDPDDNGGDGRATLTAAESLRARRSARLSRGALLLGRYEIVDELGEGGMGVVYRARDRELERDVALKLVASDKATGTRGRARLLREAQALAQLNHPNVVAVYDVGNVDGGVFIAMELVDGLRLDQWLKAKPRRWREIVTVFRDAGRALAVAHGVGLVHRDIKPTNLMISHDGRVRVLDFGLARAADPQDREPLILPAPLRDAGTATTLVPRAPDDALTETHPPELRALPTPTPSTPGSSSGGKLLETPLTEVGAVVGTPPYMAPEQHLGGACTARSDQFSLCVTFYQALYGERPFQGNNYEELADAIIQGRVRPPPPRARVPSWLRRILLRGMAPQPQDRYATMEALLDDLSRDPGQRWRRIGLSAAALAVITVGGAGLWRGMHASARLCGNAADAVRGVWDENRQRSVTAAFAATQLPYAADAARAVIRSLDAYATAWSAMRTDACEATRVRGVQSGELMDLRMQCLDRRLDELKAQADVLATADVRVVENALSAVESLPRLDECADAAALRAPVRPPADAVARARVAALRKSLARERADLTFGKIADGLTLAEPTVREARAIGYRPTEAEALYTAARLYDVDGKYETAERLLRDAAVAAEAGRDDLLAARALSSLVWVVGVRRGHHPEARELARQAQAKIERQDHAELQLAELDGYLSSMEMDDAQYDAALSHAKEALDIREKALGPSEPEVAHSLSDLGDVAVQLGRNDEALEHYRRALAIYEKTIGPEHPSVGSILTNVGVVLRSQGKYDEALASLRRARSVTEHALGPRHPNLATIYIDEAGVLRAQGKLDAAAAEYQRALDLWTASLGADHPNVGTAYFYLGEVALEDGKPALALERFHAAMRIWEAKLGASNPSLAAPLTGIGDALRAQHKLGEARAPLENAISIVEKSLGPKHPELAAPLSSLGELDLDEHKPEAAVPLFTRALAIRVANPGEKLEEAQNRFALARALRSAHREPARARELAMQARALFSGTATAKASLAAVDRFLKQN